MRCGASCALMRKRHSRSPARIVGNVLTLPSALLFYYFVPVDTEKSRPLVDIVLFIVGLIALIWLIVWQLRKQLAAGSDTGVRVRSLLTLLYPAVVLFALAYYVIQSKDHTQFVGLITRTDALYYTIVTLGTVGYGDVHAAGQLGRSISMIQVAFDLIVVGSLIAVATSRLQAASIRPRGPEDRRREE